MDVQEIISSGLLELHAAGLTSQEEGLRVQQWIKEYPEIAKAYDEIEKDIESYALANAIAPSAAVKGKIFSALNFDAAENNEASDSLTNTGKIVALTPYWKWMAVACIFLLMASGTLNLFFYNKYDTASKDLKLTEQELAQMNQDNTDLKAGMNVIQSKYSEAIRLNGVNTTPEAIAKIFWMKNTGDVYIDASNLPDTQKDQQFQLWAIVDGKPVDAGLIITSRKNDKYRIQKMRSFGRAEAFAITIEKQGGSASPTLSKMVVMGKL